MKKKFLRLFLVSLFALTLGVQNKTTYSTRLPNTSYSYNNYQYRIFSTGLDVGKAD
ncbi:MULTISPECIES: hypothetical protein [Streptococcus]|uniref:Uncharacterized protein n=1 Tax=Streptococcus mitis bv. 2 str. SK95 TaxID=1000588 RepID=F9LZK5_STROR|nr:MULTISPECIES: hypothetical protein [Streptococcus]EGU62912.1 hypothetical protein HMPREF9965_1522 [Streptococcus mitis bv. 2 str. SK95]MDG7109204.1 hypothetical protein [Streptococcus pneumoniae]MDG7113429.1 hypothetical protein [Streptococcus pneumoniae]MDG7199921.1 hypothetical protein [Streptococcus pneumoniae]MDG9060467.1 hypothetical protein [Streptococcus pneumoniae]